jgi:hypothetical protein
MAGGGGWSGHTSPLRAKCPCMAGGAGPSRHSGLHEFPFFERCAGVSRSAHSLLHLTAGASQQNPLAARSVQVLLSLRPCVLPMPFGGVPRLRLIMTVGSVLRGLAMLRAVDDVQH